MERFERIAEYLIGKYRPIGLIVYGSFADGSDGPGSDFDALVIAEGPRGHDDAVVDGVTLDVFLRPPEDLEGDYAPEDYIQILDGRILVDQRGLAAALQARVRAWLDSQPRKSREEVRQELSWCRKMLTRASREDTEGRFRLHWLLTDSLEIFCDILGEPYLGPKKALRLMAQRYGVAELLYDRALRTSDPAALRDWVRYLEALFASEPSK